jgi:hypothetical protein
MRRCRGVFWLVQGVAALLVTQAGTGCGRTGEDDADVAETAGGSGGQVTPPWGTGGWIVEGCSSNSMQMHCWVGCPGYDANRVRCDPTCTVPLPSDCPSVAAGGAPIDAALNVLAACDAVFPNGPSMGGHGGEAPACTPVCGGCFQASDCCPVTGTAVCLEGMCVYR